MEKFDWNWLLGQGIKIKTRSVPRPFPGVHPLRMGVVAKYKLQGDKNWRRWEYLGKPLRIVGEKIHLFTTDRNIVDGSMGVWEFDRGGVIASRIHELPRGFEIPDRQNDTLVRYYRYLTSLEWTRWRIPSIVPTKINLGGKARVVYAPDNAGESHWGAYKQWVEQNLVI